ncbi:uroporphyrinogen-III synthase [Dendroctonus ponderosae]|uniref:Uroporphyrinogen-III synthase n=1 Tax=Dendroctonus ponderosae TaxID=77166 RepID=U4UPK6_DENPD|nr:uroporphyrinogen-III synthase [Dendroctonus ponderosae]ERL94413.1 hypothetical protein D910_11691 [Dendroctonus ponderosae]KAH1027941.1 hypothetical protein HUJ05_001360 [Dendroctonus ponderosae]
MMIRPKSVLLMKSQDSEDGPDKYEDILRANAFEVNRVKTLVFNFKNLQKLAEKLANRDEYSGVIFSSPRCVQAVQLSSEISNHLEQWKVKDNFVVGETTYKAALDKLTWNCTGGSAGNAKNLANDILKNKLKYSKPFLFPHGNLKSDTLNLELEKEGLQLDGVEVYETTPNPNIETDFANVTSQFHSIPEYIVFFSPSGFNSSIDLIGRVATDLNKLKFIALGPVTELAICDKNMLVYGTAKKPNPEELLKVILS